MSDPLPKSGRLAAIDFGSVRIGVAICDPNQTIASPWDVYHRGNLEQDVAYFRDLSEQQELKGWIVGLPVHMSGDESQMSRQAQAFGIWLKKETNLPVVYVDERFTTAIAEQFLGEAKLSRDKRKKRRDKIAAQLLLKAYLDSPNSAVQPPITLDE